MTGVLAALYRAFYDHVLSRLPEARAVAMGQAALRALPLDRLSLFHVDDPVPEAVLSEHYLLDVVVPLARRLLTG